MSHRGSLGENLSPLLFLLHLNDLQKFLQEAHMGLKDISDLATHTFNTNLCVFFKLYILLYADDTVLLTESPKDLQNNFLEEYCHLWKLKINVAKSKVTVFSRGKIRNRPEFYFCENKLDVVDHYKYTINSQLLRKNCMIKVIELCFLNCAKADNFNCQ